MRIGVVFSLAFWISFQALAVSHRLQDVTPFVLLTRSDNNLCGSILASVPLLIPDVQVDRILRGSDPTAKGRNAIKFIADFPLRLDYRSLIAMWEQLALVLITDYPSHWHASRFMGTDESVIYIGEFRYSLVFKIDGSIYKGIIRELPEGDIWQANYQDLEMIRPPSM